MKNYISDIFCFIFFNLLLLQTLLFSQEWSEPEIIATNRNVKDFVTVVNENGHIHLLLSEDKTNDFWPDSLYFWIRVNNLWKLIESFGKDTLKMPPANGLAIDSDKNNNVHFFWGMQRETEALSFSHILYYRRFSKNKWGKIEQIQDFGKKYVTDLGIKVIPDQSILAYWTDHSQVTIYFKYFKDTLWLPAFKPFPQYSLPGNGTAFNPSIVDGIGDTLHFAFIGALDDYTLPSSSSQNFVNYSCKGLNEENWTIIKQVYRNPEELCIFPKLVITRDECRHLFWYIDNNMDYWVDNIYYSYSYNGSSWSEAIDITKYAPTPLQAVYSLNIVADTSGKLHIIWLLVNAYDYQTSFFYNYITGRENKWSDPIQLFNSNAGKKKCSLEIDQQDMLHLIWYEDIYEGNYDTVTVKYSTMQLNTSNVKTVTQSVKNLSLTCYPNPFNNMSNILYKIPSDGNVSLSIYDITGRKIKQIVSNYHQLGSYHFKFESSNFPSGVYFVKLIYNQQILTHKIILMK